ncbi:hypothetical protein LIT32_13470 [Bacillus sp. CMF21]|uniref:hypothetical protein n=1 Tax=Metabacillus dongyingensis TaxID=2874282 RepID=UPI001CBC683A|nr:hypothetical protein [Metabacillus dongyingensis]UAL50276.1 hypothetical protein K8L98_13440 [Metabacillus dongyingensis]USK26525.1 hypothetical protein LIT32_13470 [Bacillus sp. CMF21]
MNPFDHYPKSLKKMVRYIKQDASLEQLNEIKKLIDVSIYKRSLILSKGTERKKEFAGG